MKSKLSLFSLSAVLILFASCNISGVTGNKNVVKQTRTVNENFTAVKISQGINLFLTQGDTVSIITEADENIQELLKTEIENGVLKIYFTEQFGKTEAKNVYVTMPEINKITASSAADVKGKSVISSDDLTIDASSGADIEIEIDAAKLSCESSSGADIDLIGNCGTANFRASSGADIDAKELNTENVSAKTSSGADISVFAVKSLTANASSGGDISYYGNPEKLDINTSSGGDINKRNK